MRHLIPVLLALMLGLAMVGQGAVRSAPTGGTQVVLCTGDGAVAVTLGPDGAPVTPVHHHCPDCLPLLLHDSRPSAKPVALARTATRIARDPGQRKHPARFPFHPPARAPLCPLSPDQPLQPTGQIMLYRIFSAAFAVLLAVPALAQDGPQILDPYARVSPSGAGAVFLVIQNPSALDDRLIAVASNVADRVELHTHQTDANGMMQMLEVPEGFEVKAESTRALERGGDHVMLLGLTRDLKDGDTFDLTLTFERGEVITVTVPVDNARKPGGHGMHHGAPSN